MVWIILIAAFLISGCCLLFLIAPQILRRMITFYSIGSWLYLGGLIRLVLGIMLLISSTQAKCWEYAVIMGLFLAASGLSPFFLALRRMKKLCKRLQNQSDFILRLLVLLALIMWILLVYCFLPGHPFQSFPR